MGWNHWISPCFFIYLNACLYKLFGGFCKSMQCRRKYRYDDRHINGECTLVHWNTENPGWRNRIFRSTCDNGRTSGRNHGRIHQYQHAVWYGSDLCQCYRWSGRMRGIKRKDTFGFIKLSITKDKVGTDMWKDKTSFMYLCFFVMKSVVDNST